MRHFFMLGLLCLFSCKSKKTVEPINQINQAPCGAGKIIKRVNGVIATLWFNTTENRYYFLVATSTIDSGDLGFICDLPPSYRTTGTKYQFSGEYRKYDKSISPMAAGIDYYYLTLTQLKPLNPN